MPFRVDLVDLVMDIGILAFPITLAFAFLAFSIIDIVEPSLCAILHLVGLDDLLAVFLIEVDLE